MASEVVTKTDIANWTQVEDATADVKRYAEQVKDKVGKVLDRKVKHFEAVSFCSGTPGGTGSVWYAVKVDIGKGDDRFVHVMLSTQVVEGATAQFERVALYYKKDAPLEIF